MALDWTQQSFGTALTSPSTEIEMVSVSGLPLTPWRSLDSQSSVLGSPRTPTCGPNWLFGVSPPMSEITTFWPFPLSRYSGMHQTTWEAFSPTLETNCCEKVEHACPAQVSATGPKEWMSHSPSADSQVAAGSCATALSGAAARPRIASAINGARFGLNICFSLAERTAHRATGTQS